MTAIKRFYQSVTYAPQEGEGFVIHLDGKSIRTPQAKLLVSPSEDLAKAVAQEWESQKEKVVLHEMPLTRLLNTVIDRAGSEKAVLLSKIMEYAASDLVCYYAAEPEDLVRRQAACWGALTDWLAQTAGVRLVVTTSIAHAPQSAEALDRWKTEIDGMDIITLTAFQDLVGMTGSCTVSLALVRERISAKEAFEAAFLEEIWQAEKWGKDPQVETRHQIILKEIEATEKFLRLCRG